MLRSRPRRTCGRGELALRGGGAGSQAIGKMLREGDAALVPGRRPGGDRRGDARRLRPRREAGWTRRSRRSRGRGLQGLRLSLPWSWAALYLIFGGRYAVADAVLDKIGSATVDASPPPPQAAMPSSSRPGARPAPLYTGDLAACPLRLQGGARCVPEETGDRRIDVSSLRANLGFIRPSSAITRGPRTCSGRARRSRIAWGATTWRPMRCTTSGTRPRGRGRLGRGADAPAARGPRTFALRQGDPQARSGLDAHVPRRYRRCPLGGRGARGARGGGARPLARHIAPAAPRRGGRDAGAHRSSRSAGVERGAASSVARARRSAPASKSLGMIEEGESLVRLVYAEALDAAGLTGEFEGGDRERARTPARAPPRSAIPSGASASSRPCPATPAPSSWRARSRPGSTSSRPAPVRKPLRRRWARIAPGALALSSWVPSFSCQSGEGVPRRRRRALDLEGAVLVRHGEVRVLHDAGVGAHPGVDVALDGGHDGGLAELHDALGAEGERLVELGRLDVVHELVAVAHGDGLPSPHAEDPRRELAPLLVEGDWARRGWEVRPLGGGPPSRRRRRPGACRPSP